MWKKPWALVLASSLSAFAIGEAYVRSRGLSWEIDFPNEPTMHAPDPVLGWENKAGGRGARRLLYHGLGHSR